MNDVDREQMISESTVEACSGFVKMGAFEFPPARQEAPRELRASAGALMVFNPGFKFLREPELNQDSEIWLDEPTEHPELDDSDEIEVKVKQKVFTTQTHELLAEYLNW